MNDLEFEQRATVNPFDNTSEFLAAAQENPERQRMLEELKAFEQGLHQTIASVNAPEALKQGLLDIALADPAVETIPATGVAANDSNFWTRKFLPVAACLMVTIGVVMTYLPTKNSELEMEIFTHIYREAFYLEAKAEVAMSEVNQKMNDTLGIQFKESPELANLQVHVADDCWVAKENSIHMVMTGDAGALSVIVLPNSPLKEELIISDERFDGLITPTPGGNLVVVGEKGEAVSRYSHLLASNINW